MGKLSEHIRRVTDAISTLEGLGAHIDGRFLVIARAAKQGQPPLLWPGWHHEAAGRAALPNLAPRAWHDSWLGEARIQEDAVLAALVGSYLAQLEALGALLGQDLSAPSEVARFGQTQGAARALPVPHAALTSLIEAAIDSESTVALTSLADAIVWMRACGLPRSQNFGLTLDSIIDAEERAKRRALGG